MRLPEGFAHVTPYIFAENADAYVRFLEAGLGGVETLRTSRPDGTIANCQIRFHTATIMVSEASARFPASRASLYLYVEDADAVMASALKCGAVKISDVSDMSYGDRQGGIKDPSGNIWWISQRLTDEPYS